ncbi:MAG: hypothetical protein WCH63_09900 [Actinomycetota bacterium]
MSNNPSSAVTPDFATSTVAKPERMLDGFPWVSAIVLYTLSWGWSLLRPNTLYWDDWILVFMQPPKTGWLSSRSMGIGPWARLIDWSLLELGTWTLRVASFAIFFVAGLFIFEILKVGLRLRSAQLNFITLLFLIVPVNHARISISIFDYLTSYFLFFLGWFLLVRYRSTRCFILSWLVLFLSLKTHSLLFFMLLPFLHFVWLHKTQLVNSRRINLLHFQVFVIVLMPAIYLIMRNLFWPPVEGWEDYQKPTSAGLMTGLWPVLVGLLGLSIIGFRYIKKKTTHFGLVLLVVGFSITALALFPYFLAELYVGYAGRPAFITVLEFRADWRSRHQLLMPLGLALSVVGLNDLFKWKRSKNIFAGFIIVVSVALNMFWGSQYFLQSLKQEKIVELLKATKNKMVIASLGDQTLRFNGRENDFRGYEWNGFMTLAGIPIDRPGCEALPNGSVLNLKSDKPYLKALISRDLGLYFDVTPCSEILAKDS